MDFLGGLAILFWVLPIGLVVLAIVAMAGRREPDPTGARLYLFYLSTVTFVALFVVLLSLFAMTSALARLALDRDPLGHVRSLGGLDLPILEETVEVEASEPGEFGSFVEETPGQDLQPGGFEGQPEFFPLDGPPGPHIRDAFLPAIVGFLGVLVLLFHGRRLREVTRAADFPAGGSLRTFLAYLYAACFASIIIAAGAAAVALYALVRAVFPDAGGFPPDVERTRAWVDLISATVLAAASAVLFSFHWRRAAALRSGLSGGPESGP
jgi:hypothetical protein